MTNEDIAFRAMLAKATVCRISQLRSWRSVPVGIIERFTVACGVDLLRPSAGQLKRSLRRVGYLANTSPAQRRMIEKALRDLHPSTYRLSQ